MMTENKAMTRINMNKESNKVFTGQWERKGDSEILGLNKRANHKQKYGIFEGEEHHFSFRCTRFEITSTEENFQ